MSKPFFSTSLILAFATFHVSLPQLILFPTQVLGGADTLAIVINAIFYHILHTPRAHSLLVSELRRAKLAYPSPYGPISTLPYLDACIKEGLRMHPVVGHVLERVVPSSGLTLSDGTILPPGTIVGVNPWVIHYKEDIFGAKTNEFRPERWLKGDGESEEKYESRMRGMREADMAFGGGNRICLGKPLALVEVYKVVATVFARFDVSSYMPCFLCFENMAEKCIADRARGPDQGVGSA